MNHRQRYVCYMALFDDGWQNADIAVALGITEQEASDIATGIDSRGVEAGLFWERKAVKDHDGLVIERDGSGTIVRRIPPYP